MSANVLSFVFDSDSTELRELQRSVRRYAEQNIAPVSEDALKFDRARFDKMAELGFAGATISEECGGIDLSPLDVAALTFELSRVQLGPGVWLSVHLMVSKLIQRWGRGAFVESTLNDLASGKSLGAFCLTEADAGSDASALKTRATKNAEGYSLNGEKIYITSAGHADIYLVFARTSDDPKKGISAFIVPKTTPGISFGTPEKKMGCEGSPISSVRFENCQVSNAQRVGEEGDGYRVALSGLAGGRINIAAAACGLASRALEIAGRYALERRQFGKTISEFQGLQFMVADMVQQTRAAILLTRNAADELTEESKSAMLASISKCFATDTAMRVATDAVQVLGGAGYLKDYEVERIMRDAKMLQIVEGTNQIQRDRIAREFFQSLQQ